MSTALVPRYPRFNPPPLPPLPTDYRPCRFGTARLGDRELPFQVSPVYASRVHMAVLGESGSGKSKFLELLVRYLLLLGEGGMCIDPTKDLLSALASFIAHRAARGDEALARRCHLLTVGPKRAFRLNLFASLPPRSAGRLLYENALDVKGDRIVRQILRRVPAEAFEVMNRLRPRLKAVIMACGADLDGRGTRLGLGCAMALANSLHPDFAGCLDRAYPFLPKNQQATFKEIMGERVSGAARDKWESTQNALAKLLGGFADLVLGGDGPTLDVKGAIDRGEFIIAGISQSRHMSYDRAVTLLGLVMDALLEAKEAEEELPPHLRKRATLVIDEFGDLLGEDVCWSLRNDRKFELRIVPAAQNVQSLARGDLKLAQYVLSQCQTIFAFAQKLREDKEVIEDRLFGGSYGFTPKMTEVQRQRGYFAVQTVDHSRSRGTGTGWNAGASLGLTKTEMASLARSRGWSRNWSDTESEADTKNTSEAWGAGQAALSGVTHSPIMIGQQFFGTVPVQSFSSALNSHHSHAQGSAQTKGKAHTEGEAEQSGIAQVLGHALALSLGLNWGRSHAQNESVGETVKTSLLANIVSEWEWTGQYEEGTVQDQKERNMVLLHSLAQAHCFVSVYGHPYAIPVRIDHVDPLWDTPEEAWYAAEHIQEVIAAQWPYTFCPADAGGDFSLALDDESDALVDTPLDVEVRGENPFGN